jgi:hypothetical protein
MSMYNGTVPQFIKMLDNLVGWLDDATQDAETPIRPAGSSPPSRSSAAGESG